MTGVGQECLIDPLLGGRQRMTVERQHAPDESADEVVELRFRDGSVDPAVHLRGVRVEVVPAEHYLDRPRPPDQQRKALGRAAARNQAEANLRLAEDGPFPAREPDVAAECELATAPARPTTDHGDAEDVAVSQLDRGVAPARRAEPALGLPDAVMGEKVVGIGALEGDDLQTRLGFDRLDQVEDLVVHQIIDGVDRRVIEGDPPISGHLLFDGEAGRRLVHRTYLLSLDTSAFACRWRSVLAPYCST